MIKFNVPFQETGYFSKIVKDYLEKNERIAPFYNNYPDLEGFKRQITAKKESFSELSREVLHTSLEQQYKDVSISEKTKKNINLLRQNCTFTVTTGHQLNLFTGPLYFLYKIITAINLSKQLKKEFPNFDFVPVYWMATEDHDFEEIQYFNFKGNKISWNREASGAVGRLTTEGLDAVLETFSKQLGESSNEKYIKNIFKEAYLLHANLTEATRFLANKLFGEYGLVIIDGDDKALKKQFAPIVKEELVNNTSYNNVTETIKELEINYKIQVNPREINLFYLENSLRERIIFEEGIYKINNTEITFTKEEILEEAEANSEKFSPNVLMRPVYQELILPNICYIGGGGELAYWFELKKYFSAIAIPFPILLLRNSVLLITEMQMRKMDKLNISKRDLFKKQDSLINEKVATLSQITIDLSSEKAYLKKMFEELEVLSNKTDKSFLGAVKAQEKKQLKGINNLEKRLLKAQKRKYAEIVDRITVLQEALFPKQSLQERQANFSEFYIAYGEKSIPLLLNTLEPLKLEFDIMVV